jgi:hypothetical protein
VRAAPKHDVSTEARMRGGQRQHRAVCNCGWTSTWQTGDVKMADGAAQRHRNSTEIG